MRTIAIKWMVSTVGNSHVDPPMERATEVLSTVSQKADKPLIVPFFKVGFYVFFLTDAVMLHV
jgi:hypothetical protein